MNIHTHESQIGSQAGGLLIGRDNGATRGFCMGVSYYASTEYGPPGVHEDQEGFYVLEGRGTAKVGDEEFDLVPDRLVVVPPGVLHNFVNTANEELKLMFILTPAESAAAIYQRAVKAAESHNEQE